MSAEIFRPSPQPERVEPKVTTEEKITEKRLTSKDLYCINGAWMIVAYPEETKVAVAELMKKMSGGSDVNKFIQKILDAYSDVRNSGQRNTKDVDEARNFIDALKEKNGNDDELIEMLLTPSADSIIFNPEVKLRFAKERGLNLG